MLKSVILVIFISMSCCECNFMGVLDAFKIGGKVLDNVLKDGGKVVDNVLKDGGKVVDNVLKDGGKVVDNVLKDGRKVIDNSLKVGGKVLDNVLKDGVKVLDILKVDDPDKHRNVTGLITSKGYPAEEHTVQTADGFLLGVQRIPHDKDGRFKGVKKPVVILQHGLLSAASDFVFNFPHQSLGFLLADAGYDVWLGNTRGNTYSRRHIKYSPKQHEFWDYSFDEMAKYDLPAIIDYALNATGEEKVYYIGHSQGTTSAFALLSESPEYNEKIRLFVALAPVTTVGYITNAVKYLAPFTTELDFFAKLVGIDEFLPNNMVMKLLSEFVCDTSERFICENIIFLSFGYDKYELNATRIGVYAAHSPAGTSSKSIAHYGQLVNSGSFTHFDYGKKGNTKRYNQTTPQEYDVSRITTPVALIWSLNDPLADPVDVDILQKKLKSMVTSYCVPFEFFNHGDFVMAIHANRFVYDKVFELLKQY